MAGRRWGSVLAVVALLALPAAARAADAPGAPGDVATWTTGDKDGFATSTTPASKVWLHARRRRADRGLLRPTSARRASATCSSSSPTARRSSSASARTRPTSITLADPRSLTYRQVDTDALRALAHHEDLHDRSGALGGARRRPLRVAHRPAAAALRAARPGAVEHRRRRPRRQRRHARSSPPTPTTRPRSRRSPAPREALERLRRRERRLERPAAPTSGSTGPTSARPIRATSSRSRSCR